MAIIDVIHRDEGGNFWRESLPVNDALLAALRFIRKNPDGFCTIELTIQARGCLNVTRLAASEYLLSGNSGCTAARSGDDACDLNKDPGRTSIVAA